MEDEVLEFNYRYPRRVSLWHEHIEIPRIRYQPRMVKCVVRFEEISDVLEENAQSRKISESRNWGNEYSI